ncbi:MAG: SsrA-binding protein SmpB [Deltaproteobacteria bacterium]|nr:SsrA-binding protein SmpB [Deltaproteobacteria bacterium]
MKSDSKKILCANSKARHSYDIVETFEAGIVLGGPEVKSLRNSGGNIKDSYAIIRHTEAFLNNLHIAPYAQASIHNFDPTRPRKLLLHRREITRLSVKIKEKGLTLIPLRIYLKGSLIKVELALAKGKHVHDKKEAIKERDIKRELDREVKSWR